MGPQNAVMGESYGTELPQTQVDEQDLVIEKNAAKFSKTKEYKALKEHLEGRIAFYQNHLPDGRDIQLSGLSMDELGRQWVAANAIVSEFQAVLNAYEQARQAVEDAKVV